MRKINNMPIGKTFFIDTFDNGNMLKLYGDFASLVEGVAYVSKELPTYDMLIGSALMVSESLCEVSFVDTVDHNKDLELIAKRRADTIEKVESMEDVEMIKALGAELGLVLDDRKKRLDSVRADFIKIYKEDQGI